MQEKYFLIIGGEDGTAYPYYDLSDPFIKIKLFDSIEQIENLMKNVPTPFGWEVYIWGI